VLGFPLVGAAAQVARKRFPASNFEEKLFAELQQDIFHIDEKYA
jgi:hypothetical protein